LLWNSILKKSTPQNSSFSHGEILVWTAAGSYQGTGFSRAVTRNFEFGL